MQSRSISYDRKGRPYDPMNTPIMFNPDGTITSLALPGRGPGEDNMNPDGVFGPGGAQGPGSSKDQESDTSMISSGGLTEE